MLFKGLNEKRHRLLSKYYESKPIKMKFGKGVFLVTEIMCVCINFEREENSIRQ
jgi:hypothetical protein